MPKMWVNDSGTWKQVQRMWVNQGGTWKNVKSNYINDQGTNRLVYPDVTSGNVTYNQPGIYEYVVPAGTKQLQITVAGAGGGAGGNDTYNGNAGAGGNLVTWTTSAYNIWPGNTIVIGVGSQGQSGGTGANAAGGTGGTLEWYGNSFAGGSGGNSGTSGSSGSGGGGGAASYVAMGNVIFGAASGGPGGGGGGALSAGQPYPAIPGRYRTTYTYGGNGTPKSFSGTDGGGGGGGGGGFDGSWNVSTSWGGGGVGGYLVAGDNGAYSGTYGNTYVSLAPNEGGNSIRTYGIATNGGPVGSNSGGVGYVIIVPIF